MKEFQWELKRRRPSEVRIVLEFAAIRSVEELVAALSRRLVSGRGDLTVVDHTGVVLSSRSAFVRGLR